MIEKMNYENRAKVFTALSDATRLRLVDLLLGADEISCSEIAQRLDISLSLSCHHLKVLTEAGLVKNYKKGQTRYYSLERAVLNYTLESLR
ncbi:metalloregulator ArsR/SmtB family transcription factor [Nostoc sp. UHCC 0302]|jgi:ArsR family transcriptional regulator|uniref:ArsR/SmtB family transcription factor n=1 Tax=Nostoc sp. UHCC 0302 TaxID=3134896 RepID=UPI00311CDCCB